ncbi:class I SAM-dependent methyltransferase [Heliophilum fasciatum]|uniref:Methyltransferase family protein n=1 Tax=Heliophilum fasciatum TaxID=35700 RepID=A0A4R2RY41_9FIRM|nr:class I SAM-dependent methyltransferase [Heliophilum fasciatum]MCW2276981.1 SAM-dependent methyltransferase [Heliophilum fasciatum]TCP68493.1 methyltransferase family protein [Heliophilum fasciatum]
MAKYRESGMPDEQTWNTFFHPTEIIQKIGIGEQVKTLLDIGCGYGTFLLPIAEIVSQKVIGIDIDDQILNICKDKIKGRTDEKILLVHGDISADATRKALEEYKDKIDYITLFNILHCEEPMALLKNAFDLLSDYGRIGVIHWKYEKTPRGPSMDIRPTPTMIIDWAAKTGFTLEKQVELPPYHYGLVFIKKPIVKTMDY